MSTECYAMVRGSGLRVTALDKRGRVPDEIAYIATKSITRITLNEVSESASSDVMRNDENRIRLHIVRPAVTTRYAADIEFLDCDPALISMMSGMPVVENAAGDIVGFDAATRLPAVAFAMEVWSRLAGATCTPESGGAGFGLGGFGLGPFGFGEPTGLPSGRPWGYTLFPFIKGGILTGFAFENGKVSFALVGAQVLRGGKWGSGPHDLEYIDDVPQRLNPPVQPRTHFRQTIIIADPPPATNGVAYLTDIIDGGSAAVTSDDIIDGGTASVTTEDIIDGGAA